MHDEFVGDNYFYDKYLGHVDRHVYDHDGYISQLVPAHLGHVFRREQGDNIMAYEESIYKGK